MTRTAPLADSLIRHVSNLPAYSPPAHHGTVNRRLVDCAAGVGFEMILGRIEPGGAADRHYHRDETQVVYILKGEAMVALGEEAARRCGPGSVIRIPPGLAHEIAVAGGGPLEVIVLYAPPLSADGFVTAPRAGEGA